MKKYSFPPLAGEDSEILILGSLPGEKSLEMQQYYAFPQNAFWKIMFQIFEKDFSDDYEVRKKLIIDNKLALWDTIQSGTRKGSLDSDIKNEEPNDIVGFIKEHPHIKRILLNGKKPEAMFKKYIGDVGIETVTMPSTSPANARVKYEQKLDVWKAAILDSSN